LLLSVPLLTQGLPLSESTSVEVSLLGGDESLQLDLEPHLDANIGVDKRCLRGICNIFKKGPGTNTPATGGGGGGGGSGAARNNPSNPNWRGTTNPAPQTNPVPQTIPDTPGTAPAVPPANVPGTNTGTEGITPAVAPPDPNALGGGLPRTGNGSPDLQTPNPSNQGQDTTFPPPPGSRDGSDVAAPPGTGQGQVTPPVPGSRDGSDVAAAPPGTSQGQGSNTPPARGSSDGNNPATPPNPLGGGLPRSGNSPDRQSGTSGGGRSGTSSANSRANHAPAVSPPLPANLAARQVEMRDLPPAFPDNAPLHGFRSQEERDAFNAFFAREHEGVDAPDNGGYVLFTAKSHDQVEPFKAAQRQQGREYFAWYDTYPKGTPARAALDKLGDIDKRNEVAVDRGEPGARDTFFFDNALSWGQSRRAARRGGDLPVLYGDSSNDMMWADSFFGRVEANIATHPNSGVTRIVRVNGDNVGGAPVPIWDRNQHAPIGDKVDDVDWSAHPTDYFQPNQPFTKMQTPPPRDPNAPAVNVPPGSLYSSNTPNWPARGAAPATAGTAPVVPGTAPAAPGTAPES